MRLIARFRKSHAFECRVRGSESDMRSSAELRVTCARMRSVGFRELHALECGVQRVTSARVQSSESDMRSNADCGLQRVTECGLKELHALECGFRE